MHYDFKFTEIKIDDLRVNHAVSAPNEQGAGWTRIKRLVCFQAEYGGWSVMVSGHADEDIPDYQVITALSWRVRDVMRSLGVDLPLVEWLEPAPAEVLP